LESDFDCLTDRVVRQNDNVKDKDANQIV